MNFKINVKTNKLSVFFCCNLYSIVKLLELKFFINIYENLAKQLFTLELVLHVQNDHDLKILYDF